MESAENMDLADFSVLRKGESNARWSRARLLEKNASLRDQRRVDGIYPTLRRNPSGFAVKISLLLMLSVWIGLAQTQTSLPPMVTVATGNSITRQSQWDPADNGYWHTNSEIHLANALSGSPMIFNRIKPTTRTDTWGIYGYSGQTLPGILADLPVQFFAPLEAAGIVPGLVIGNALLENDIAGDASVIQMQSSLTQWLGNMRQRWPGARILLCTPHPNTNYNTPSRVSNYLAMRDYIGGLDDGSTIFVARTDAYENPSAPGTPLPGYTVQDDGIHPNAKGAMLLARSMASALLRIASKWTQPSYIDVSTNIMFSGSQPAYGTGVSGTVPTGTGINWQNGTFVATAENPDFTLQVTTAPTTGRVLDLGTFNMGPLSLHAKQVSPFLVVQIVSGAANLRSVELAPRMFYGGQKNSFLNYIKDYSNDAEPDFVDGDIFTLREPPLVPPSGSISAVNIYVRCVMKLAGGATTLRFISGGMGIVE
jgi:lysophospholipase L1-like esterase